MALEPINVYAENIISIDGALSIRMQDETYNPKSDSPLKEIPDSEWHNLANVSSMQEILKTKDNPKRYFSRVQLAAVENENSRITGRGWKFTCVNHSMLFEAIRLGVKDPTSAESLAALSADSETGFAFNASNNPYTPCILRVEKYNEDGKLLQTLFCYAKVKCTEGSTYEGDIHDDVIEVEIVPSTQNRGFNTSLMTLQKASS